MFLQLSLSLLLTFITIVLLPCPFTGPKMFCAGPNFLSQPKNLVPLQKLLYRHKKQFCWMQIIFLSGTKCLWLAQYVNKFLGWLKKFGPAQNILGPVKGQGNSPFSVVMYGLWMVSYRKGAEGKTKEKRRNSTEYTPGQDGQCLQFMKRSVRAIYINNKLM